MPSSELILPFGLPPPELAKDLLRQLHAPALATLLGHAGIRHLQADPYARVLPHQAWLLGRMGQAAQLADVALAAMQALGLPQPAGACLVLQPAHFHIARDHLVLTDLRHLPLSESEARALFAAAAPLFAEANMELVWGNARLWFLHADALCELETSAPDMAVGHNVDIWMPKGEGERAWRRIHNEVQMCWHSHEVNAQRELAGQKPVNALWCWNAKADAGAVPPVKLQALSAFLPASGLPAAAKAGDGLQVFDGLSSAALAGDWGRWLQAMQEAEQQLFAPALENLKAGRLSEARLLLADDRQILQADCSRLALKKFWRRPTLASLNIPREDAA